MDHKRWRMRALAGTVGALAAVVVSVAPSRADLAPPVIAAPAEDSLQPGVAPASVTFTGTAAPGSSVEVFDTLPVPDSLGTATANDAGSWSLSVSMSDGSHSVNAVSSGEGGTSAPSELRTFTVDAIRPGAQIGAPAEDHVFPAGEQPVVSGSATDDRELHAVKVEYWALGQLKLVQLADCACDGQTSAVWSHEPALQPGTYIAKVWSFDAAGNASLMAQREFTTIGSEIPFQQPNPTLPNVPGIEPPDLFGPGEGTTQPGADRPVTFTGSTEPGSRVELYEEIDGLGTIGTAIDDDEDGAWRMNVRLADGTYGVRARAFDDDGNVSELSDLIVFEVDAGRPVLEDLPTGIPLFLPTQQVVLDGVLTDARATGSVVLEYWLGDDIVLRDMADCADCGEQEAAWSHAPQLPGPGYYHVRVLAFDEAGNPSHQGVIKFISGNP